MATLTSLSNQFRQDQALLARQTTDRLAGVFPALNMKSIDASRTGWMTAVESIALDAHKQSAERGMELYADYRKASGVRGQIGFTRADFAAGKLRSSLLYVGAYQAKELMGMGIRIPEVARTVFTATTGAAVRRVLEGARDTVELTAIRDDQAQGWIRVTGPRPCGFCAMVAMNQYYSATSALTVVGRRGGPRQRSGVARPQPIGARYHDHCQCSAIPAFNLDAWPDGYVDQLSRFEELWTRVEGKTSQEQVQSFNRIIDAEYRR